MRKLLARAAHVASGTWALATKPETARRVRGGGQLIRLDYPVDFRVRGGPTARHPQLERLFEAARDGIAAQVETVVRFADDLARIPANAGDAEPTPRWNNGWFSGLDGMAAYSMVRSLAPRRFVEIGSGNSTRFVRRAIEDGKLPTRVTSIDPYPRAEIDRICDDVIRKPFEQVTPSELGKLEAGDVLFLDGSHRVFQNSDTTAFFMDLLPSLAPGVTVQVHDIWLPFDYPPEFVGRFYNEQYLLAMWILGRNDPGTVLLPARWVLDDPPLRAKLEPLYQRLVANGHTERLVGGSFWFRT